MNKVELEKLSKSQQFYNKIKKTIPTLKKSVKQMVQDKPVIENIIQPPIHFQDKPIPTPRTKINVEKMVQKYEDIIKKSILKKHENQNTVFKNQKKFKIFNQN